LTAALVFRIGGCALQSICLQSTVLPRSSSREWCTVYTALLSYCLPSSCHSSPPPAGAPPGLAIHPPVWPGVPRANKAVSKEKPQGSDSKYSRDDQTVLQQHVAFFDRWAGSLAATALDQATHTVLCLCQWQTSVDIRHQPWLPWLATYPEPWHCIMA
jgi:hypothetical protein